MKSLTSRCIATVFALALLLSFNTAASNAINRAESDLFFNSQNTCSKITDQELTQTVINRLKADPEIGTQINHLNVSVKKRVVKLEGWLDEELIPKAVNIVKQTPCVKKVKNKLKESGGASCGPRQKPCGGICIDEDSDCNITLPQNVQN